MRRFCTSDPVDKKTCYYIDRPDIMKEALDHIENWRYFTVSAPRQSGKTTLLNDIVEKTKDKYLPIFISFESFGNIKTEEMFIKNFNKKVKNFFRFNMNIEFEPKKITAISDLDEYIININKKFKKRNNIDDR
ncbi:AAA-like domain-containing protein [Marinitoga sp. 1154]|uniref:AAA-like domain-containing protein n=1 Tax=Marinitoga sp. 1154 TaxID=1643335 RepID=UPI0020CA41CB|nr:AAA-like domain-containing protein [Marinitoga sp. 1154]